MYTLSYIKELLIKKLKGKSLPVNWELEVNEYIKSKDIISNRPIGEFNTEETKMQNKIQLSQANTYYHFLKKDNLDDYALPNKFNPAGMLTRGFVLEPLNTYTYVYNWCGIKGIVNLEKDPNPESKRFYLEIEGEQILLEGNPIQNFVFEIPNEDLIKDFIKCKVRSETAEELYDELYQLFDTFVEIYPKSLFTLMILFIFESWLVEKLKTVFFVSIMGEFGGGKTCILEILTALSRHGYMTPNPSTSFVGRVIEAQKLTLAVDEIDCLKGTEDSDLIQLIRTSYRRGSRYSRINKSSMEPEFFCTFGAKAFTAHTDLEQALQTRTMPIITTEALDKLVPLINYIKDSFCKRLHDKLFLWYIDNSILIDYIDYIDIDSRERVEYDRQKIYKMLVSVLNESQFSQFGQLGGRNAELGLVVANLLKMLNLNNVNLLTHIKESFKIKKEMEEEKFDTGDIGLCRDFLADKYKDYSKNLHFVTKDGQFKIANKDLYEGFNQLLRDKGKRGITPSEFKGFLRDFGFESGVSRKKMLVLLTNEINKVAQEPKSRLCCVFTPKAMRKLGLPLEVLEHRKDHKEELKVEQIEVKVK